MQLVIDWKEQKGKQGEDMTEFNGISSQILNEYQETVNEGLQKNF